MRGVQRLFADMTAVVEDLHGIAIEGQEGGHSADMLLALVSHAHERVAALQAVAVVIRLRLGQHQQ